jgi:hypothetical protein
MKNTNTTRHVIIIYRFKFSILAIISPTNGIFLISFRSFCVVIFVINNATHMYINALKIPIYLNKKFGYYNIILKNYLTII